MKDKLGTFPYLKKDIKDMANGHKYNYFLWSSEQISMVGYLKSGKHV